MPVRRKIEKELVAGLRITARELAKARGYKGAYAKTKIENYVNGWVAEHAWLRVLNEADRLYQYRGQYIGDPDEAGADFTMLGSDNAKVSVGIRSRKRSLMDQYEQVPYPTRRLQPGDEQKKVADVVIASDVAPSEGGDMEVRFHGAVRRDRLLELGKDAETIGSAPNQETASLIPLSEFSWDELEDRVGWKPTEEE
jgi:hypothetical protein